MKLLDRIALNRLLKFIGNLIISILKIYNKKEGGSKPEPNYRPRPIIDFFKKKLKK